MSETNYYRKYQKYKNKYQQQQQFAGMQAEPVNNTVNLTIFYLQDHEKQPPFLFTGSFPITDTVLTLKMALFAELQQKVGQPINSSCLKKSNANVVYNYQYDDQVHYSITKTPIYGSFIPGNYPPVPRNEHCLKVDQSSLYDFHGVPGCQTKTHRGHRGASWNVIVCPERCYSETIGSLEPAEAGDGYLQQMNYVHRYNPREKVVETTINGPLPGLTQKIPFYQGLLLKEWNSPLEQKLGRPPKDPQIDPRRLRIKKVSNIQDIKMVIGSYPFSKIPVKNQTPEEKKLMAVNEMGQLVSNYIYDMDQMSPISDTDILANLIHRLPKTTEGAYYMIAFNNPPRGLLRRRELGN